MAAADRPLRHRTQPEKSDDRPGGRRGASPFRGNSGGDPAPEQSGNSPGEVAADSAGGTARTGRKTGLRELAPIEAENCVAFSSSTVEFRGDERLYGTTASACRLPLSLGLVSPGNRRSRVSALPRTSEIDQYDLRKCADRGLCKTDAKCEPGNHRQYRDRLPSWNSNSRAGGKQVRRTGRTESSPDVAATLCSSAG